MAGTRDRERHLGSVGPADRAMAMYTPDGMHDPRRQPIVYDPSGLWIALAILVLLIAVFFGVAFLAFLLVRTPEGQVFPRMAFHARRLRSRRSSSGRTPGRTTRYARR